MRRAATDRPLRGGTIFPRMLVMFLVVLLATTLVIWGVMTPTLRRREFQETLRSQSYSIEQVGQNLAGYFAHALQYLGLPVHVISGGVSDYYDRISLVTPDDLVIVTCFQRYTSLTVELVRDLHSRGVPIALITDNGPSPLYTEAEVVFRCSISSQGYFPCYASYMALTNAICQAAAAYFESAPAHVRELEQKLLRLGVFI